MLKFLRHSRLFGSRVYFSPDKSIIKRRMKRPEELKLYSLKINISLELSGIRADRPNPDESRRVYMRNFRKQ